MAHTASNQAAQPFGRSHPITKPYVVVIFGHTGVGISSLLNLIVGYPICIENPDAKTTTTSHKIKHHTTKLPGSEKQFSFYEVPGFGGRCPDQTILKMIQQIERDEGIDLFMYCLRTQKGMAFSNFVRRIGDIPEQKVPMIAVVTALERFGIKEGAGMEAWWDTLVEGGLTNGGFVERMCFGGMDTFDAHACITTLSPRDADDNPNLRKRRDLSEEHIRALILDNCKRRPRRRASSHSSYNCLAALFSRWL